MLLRPGYDDHVHEAEQHLLMALRPLPLRRNKHGAPPRPRKREVDAALRTRSAPALRWPSRWFCRRCCGLGRRAHGVRVVTTGESVGLDRVTASFESASLAALWQPHISRSFWMRHTRGMLAQDAMKQHGRGHPTRGLSTVSHTHDLVFTPRTVAFCKPVVARLRSGAETKQICVCTE